MTKLPTQYISRFSLLQVCTTEQVANEQALYDQSAIVRFLLFTFKARSGGQVEVSGGLGSSHFSLLLGHGQVVDQLPGIRSHHL